MTLPPRIQGDVHRILNRAARRLLAEQANGDAVTAATRSDHVRPGLIDAIKLMLALRDEPCEGEPFTWARRMHRTRTGLTDAHPRDAVEGLRRRMILASSGTKARGVFGGLNLYWLRMLVEMLGSLDAVVNEFVIAFNATVIDDSEPASAARRAGGNRDDEQLFLIQHPVRPHE